VFTSRDLAYLEDEFRTLAELCADRAETPAEVRALIVERRLPRPSYVLDDGTELFPPDYVALIDAAGGADRLRTDFEVRYRVACAAHGRGSGELEDDWQAYLDGIYGVCLREATPESIVEKGALIDAVELLLDEPRPADAEWRRALSVHVSALDALEREFAPDFDRDPARFGRPPSRDRLIAAARARFPSAFSGH
jgi:hypothetical protein